jgi:hypothetical protein
MKTNAKIMAAMTRVLALVAGFGLAATALSAPFTLTNGPGDGTISVGVDGFGAFGSAISSDAGDAFYNRVGAGTSAGTIYRSELAIRIGGAGARTFLSTPGLANPVVSGSPTSAASSFLFGSLTFQLQQTIIPIYTGGVLTGSELRQDYSILNTGTSSVSFELVRYLDGDLQFDGSLVDGGGRLVSGGREFLFQTDSATGPNATTNLVGISALGGTIPLINRYEIDSFSGLFTKILTGAALDDTVSGDGADADHFIDPAGGYDVTLALRNDFSLGAGASTTYSTSTYFGSGSPAAVAQAVVAAVPEPGSALVGFLLCGFIVSVHLGRPKRAPGVS